MHKNMLMPRLLGYLGLIPFIVSSLLVWKTEYQLYATQSLSLYAAVIITFIGGVHWGLAMQSLKKIGDTNSDSIRKQFIFSVMPSLVAWLAVLLAQSYSLIIIAISFVIFWFVEKTIFSGAFENWYTKLRNHLTLFATTFIVIGWLGTR